jgi:hypothetical protein
MEWRVNEGWVRSFSCFIYLCLFQRCLKGDNDSCKCEDPLDPQSRGEFRGWAKAQVGNTNLVQSLVDQGKVTPDIAFLGASVIEEMSGKWFGNDGDDNLKSLKSLFDKNFQKSEGSELDAVALGIAGDTVRVIHFSYCSS